MSDPTTLEPGIVLDERYRIEEEIGAGGMAIVYRVRDLRLETLCALKVLNSGLGIHQKARQGFIREARVIARMRHPHIIGVRDVRDNGMCYIAMDLIHGVSAHRRMTTVHIGPKEAVRIVLAVLDGLEAGHRHKPQIIHRDIKPENVLLGDNGSVVIIDYGLAHFHPDSDGTDEQMTTAKMGTLVYASPEQKAGSPDVDHRTDVFSAGALLWALLKGRAPTEIVLIDREESMRRGIPKPLLDVIMRAVQYNKARRYRSAADMATALRAASKLLPEDAIDGGLFPETEEPEPAKFRVPNPFTGRTVNWRGLGAVAAVVLVFGGVGAWFSRTDGTPLATEVADVVKDTPPPSAVALTTATTPHAVKAEEPAPIAVQATAETPRPEPPVVVQKQTPTVEKTPVVVQKPKGQKTEAAPDTTPRVVHKPVKKAAAGSTVSITAGVKNVDVREVWLFSRTAGTAKWNSTPMRGSQDAGYQASLTAATDDVEYYVKATDTHGDVVPGSGDRFTYYTISVD